MVIPVSFSAGEEKLAGLLVRGNASEKPEVLFLHGAGRGSKQRPLPIAEYLLEKEKVSSFLFDFSGHGESSGILVASSLAKRVAEARAALQFFNPKEKFSICAFSMGGHIALELLADFQIENLVLFYPGIYTHKAKEVQFNQNFSEIIRQPESWKQATVIKNLHTFRGNLLIVIGDKDGVIPSGVIELIDAAAQQTKRKEVLRIQGADHLFLQKLLQDPTQKQMLCEKVADYLLQ